jgi:hypothetical protein
MAKERLVDLAASVVADEQPLEVVSQAKVRSTTQRTVPSPEPCSGLLRVITGVMPRSRTRRRYRRGRSLGRRRARPAAPLTGGTRSSSGINCVTFVAVPEGDVVYERRHVLASSVRTCE